MSSTENKMQNTNWREGYTAGYTAGAKAATERVLGIVDDIYRSCPAWKVWYDEYMAIRRRVEEGD